MMKIGECIHSVQGLGRIAALLPRSLEQIPDPNQTEPYHLTSSGADGKSPMLPPSSR